MASTSHSRAYADLLVYMVIFTMAMDAATASITETCGRELGMKSGVITNEQIYASTTFDSALGPWSAYYARIGHQRAWYASVNNRNQWLQVDLRKQMVITGVQTQGHYSNTYGSNYVETFKLQFKTETTSSWLDAFDGKEFEGNNGANRIKHNNFTTPVVASAIRFLPLTWHEGIALRVEILGCDLSDITCGEPPTILDTLITANSSGVSFGAWRKYECAAGFTSPASDYDLICGVNGTWYWTNGAPDCSDAATSTGGTAISSPTTVAGSLHPSTSSPDTSLGSACGAESGVCAGIAVGTAVVGVVIGVLATLLVQHMRAKRAYSQETEAYEDVLTRPRPVPTRQPASAHGEHDTSITMETVPPRARPQVECAYQELKPAVYESLRKH